MRRELVLTAMGFVGCVCAAAELPRVTLQAGDRLQGFVVRTVEELPDIRARFVRMTYEKNGADLVWLARAEENKTFGIAFRTPPGDDTGVAHILEHSVLCGSGRFPVKEPFVELLKSSMATYLNASTWPDLTCYPVSTRNARDFSNLIEVYLDAVFDPRCVREPWVLDQEGWHYEAAGDGSLTRSGVVYSEMKGAFASPDTVAFHGLKRLLFPDTCYGFVSGGDPAHIPELTFDAFRAFYAKHYHPSNARIFLDGDLDLASVLAQLDRVLSRYDRAEVKSQIPLQRPVARRESVRYESAVEDRRVILKDGWVFSSFADRETQLVFDVLSDYFTGTNESPLKKALLDAGLCDDVDFYATSFKQLMACVTVRNTTPDQADACRRVIRETFEKACREGLDRKRLLAILDKLEFQRLELDTGRSPKGIVLMNLAMDGWIHDGNPADAFRFSELFSAVRAKLGDRLFESCLERFVLANPHRAELTLLPSATLGAERAKAEAEKLAAFRESLPLEELTRLTEGAFALKARQSAADRPEDLATLPRLRVADVPLEGRVTPCATSVTDGVTVLRPDVDVEGLFYLRLSFKVDDLSDDELRDLPLLASLVGQLRTAKRSAVDLQTAIDGTFGDFSLDPSAFLRGTWLTVNVSALNRRQDEVLALVPEILFETSFDDARAIADLRTQVRERLERAASRSGDSFAMRRAVRGFSETARQAELLEGIDQIRRLQEPACTTDFAALAKKVFMRERLTVTATAGATDAFVADLIRSVPARGEAAPSSVQGRAGVRPPPAVSEGFEIPGDIAFSALGAHLPSGQQRRGEHLVAGRIVSLDHLWNAVRVKGGAYGASHFVSQSGNVVFRSYRDPNPAGARQAFLKAGQALRDFVASKQSFEKFQVASIGTLEPYRSPKVEVDAVLAERHFAGRTPEDLQRTRREVLSVTPAALLKVADELDAAVTNGVLCVVGAKSILDSCALDRVEPIVPSKSKETK